MNTDDATESRPRSRAVDVVLIIAIVALVILAIQSVVTRSAQNSSRAGARSEADVAASGSDPSGAFAEKLGIKVTGANLAVGGTRLSVRYRVDDPQRAIQLTNDSFRAYLLNADGKPLRLPSGPSAETIQNQSGQVPRQGYLYSHFFPNPNYSVKSGDQITLVIGDMRESLVVQ